MSDIFFSQTSAIPTLLFKNDILIDPEGTMWKVFENTNLKSASSIGVSDPIKLKPQSQYYTGELVISDYLSGTNELIFTREIDYGTTC